MENTYVEPTVKKAYEKIIQKRKIKQLERNDKLIWVASKDGRYSVKNGYRVITHSKRWEEVNIPLKLCWDSFCLLKAGLFLWMAS